MRKYYLRLSFAEDVVCLGILYLVLVGERVGGEMLTRGRGVRGEGREGGEEEAEEGNRWERDLKISLKFRTNGESLGHFLIILTMMFMLLSTVKN